jgi:hypothetical protein
MTIDSVESRDVMMTARVLNLFKRQHEIEAEIQELSRESREIAHALTELRVLSL